MSLSKYSIDSRVSIIHLMLWAVFNTWLELTLTLTLAADAYAFAKETLKRPWFTHLNRIVLYGVNLGLLRGQTPIAIIVTKRTLSLVTVDCRLLDSRSSLFCLAARH